LAKIVIFPTVYKILLQVEIFEKPHLEKKNESYLKLSERFLRKSNLKEISQKSGL